MPLKNFNVLAGAEFHKVSGLGFKPHETYHGTRLRIGRDPQEYWLVKGVRDVRQAPQRETEAQHEA